MPARRAQLSGNAFEQFRRARQAGLFPFAGQQLSSDAKRIVDTSIEPILRTGSNIGQPTAEQKRRSQREVLPKVLMQTAQSLQGAIPAKDVRALIKLAPLFARHINAKHQPNEILEYSVNIAPEERELAKSLDEKTVDALRDALFRLKQQIGFETGDRYNITRNWASERPYPELDLFTQQLEFRAKHNIFHSVVAIHTILKIARQ